MIRRQLQISIILELNSGCMNQITQTGIACANKIVPDLTASGGTRLFLEKQSDQELFV